MEDVAGNFATLGASGAFDMADRGARIIDYIARTEIAELRQKVTALDTIGEIRHKDLLRDVTSLETTIGSISSKLDRWMTALIVILVAIAAYFLTRFGLPGA